MTSQTSSPQQRPTAAPPVMLNPVAAAALVATGQPWTLPCHYCPPDAVHMQGGTAGLAAHIATVHPEAVPS